MPKKKFSGPNAKAQEARDRKAAVKANEKAKKEKDAEDARWADDGRIHDNAKAHARRKEEEARKAEKAERDAKKRALEAEESKQNVKAQPHQKLTQAKVQAMAERQRRLEAEERARKRESELRGIVEINHDLENINLAIADSRAEDEKKFGAGNVIDAHGVDAALAAVGPGDGVDRHPERRAKALHMKFEEDYLPVVKEEHPGLRLSQYKQILWKMWLKAPENPRNQLAEE